MVPSSLLTMENEIKQVRLPFPPPPRHKNAGLSVGRTGGDPPSHFSQN